MVNIDIETKNSLDIYIINNHNEMKNRSVSIEGFARVRQFHLDISRSILYTCVCETSSSYILCTQIYTKYYSKNVLRSLYCILTWLTIDFF